MTQEVSEWVEDLLKVGMEEFAEKIEVIVRVEGGLTTKGYLCEENAKNLGGRRLNLSRGAHYLSAELLPPHAEPFTEFLREGLS